MSPCSILILCIFISVTIAEWPLSLSDANGGDNCVICTLITAIIAQLGQLYQIPPLSAFELFCSFLSQDILHDACDAACDIFGPQIAHYLDLGYNPDETCFALNWCNDNDGPMCRLFPPYNKDADIKQERMTNIDNGIGFGSEPALCNITEFKPICDVLERWGDDHYPVDDIDQDRFSDKDTMRGVNWRGRDCDDLVKDVHPGRVAMDGDIGFDSNCNGIKGIDNRTKLPYEDMFCKHTKQYGVAVKFDNDKNMFLMSESDFQFP